MNDNMIRHYAIGGELAYYLTDVLAVGVEGQYYVHSFQEPYDLVARQARRLPTVNEYNWSAALDFHYVPVYGKFAVLDHKLVTWESFFTAGIGAGQSEVDPARHQVPRVHEPPDHAERRRVACGSSSRSGSPSTSGSATTCSTTTSSPRNRSETMFATAADAKTNAEGSLINNLMFQIGVSFWLPDVVRVHHLPLSEEHAMKNHSVAGRGSGARGVRRARGPGRSPSAARTASPPTSRSATAACWSSNRFEFAPLFESTINADFRHIIGGGAKLEYHLGDMFSIGVIGVARPRSTPAGQQDRPDADDPAAKPDMVNAGMTSASRAATSSSIT